VTTIFPVIFGWIAQKYSTVPAVENVCENLSLVSRALEWNLHPKPRKSAKCPIADIVEQFLLVIGATSGVDGPLPTKAH
jgi:hypothetical protein